MEQNLLHRAVVYWEATQTTLLSQESTWCKRVVKYLRRKMIIWPVSVPVRMSPASVQDSTEPLSVFTFSSPTWCCKRFIRAHEPSWKHQHAHISWSTHSSITALSQGILARLRLCLMWALSRCRFIKIRWAENAERPSGNKRNIMSCVYFTVTIYISVTIHENELECSAWTNLCVKWCMNTSKALTTWAHQHQLHLRVTSAAFHLLLTVADTQKHKELHYNPPK